MLKGLRMFLFIVRALFACRQGLVVSSGVPVCALPRSRFSAALAVLVFPLWRARSGIVRNLRRPRPPRRPTYHGSQGSWSRANWAVDR